MPTSDSLAFISFIDLIEGTIDKSNIKGRIVYIGYDGNDKNFLTTGIRKTKSHRLYFYCPERALLSFAK